MEWLKNKGIELLVLCFSTRAFTVAHHCPCHALCKCDGLAEAKASFVLPNTLIYFPAPLPLYYLFIYIYPPTNVP